MAKLNLKKVTAIRTHAAMFVSGWGSIDNMLPSPRKNFVGLSMERSLEGVVVSATGKVTFLVPWGNIINAELASTEEKAE